MKNVAIIGFGYVGKAMGRFFQDHFNIYVYDPFLDDESVKEISKLGYSQETKWEAINSCDLAVVCVPTPQGKDDSVDLSIIEDTIKNLNTPLILIKSTIPPKTTERLIEETGKPIVFSPEYIGEGNYVVQWWKDSGYPHPTDMKKHDFQIFGGEKKNTKGVLQFFKKVLGPGVRYIQTDSTTAELTKYMENSWGATKVIFSNEFCKIAEAFGVDYDELRELHLQDGRVERMHTTVFEDNRGFGGKCYPKDVNGIVKASEEVGYEPKLLKEVLSTNDDLRKEYED